MGILDELAKLGCNIDEALERCMGDPSFLERMYKKLPASIHSVASDSSNEESSDILQCLDSGNVEKAINIAHTLKGVMGNLSVVPLYEAYSMATDLLRQGDCEKARKIIEDILPIQESIVRIINKYL